MSGGARFAAAAGLLTKVVRDDYIKQQLRKGVMSDTEASAPETLALRASDDASRRLYFWQLYSVLGPARIEAFIRTFYESVLADEEAPWFRDAFAEAGDLTHHVRGQLLFWTDVMAGGGAYRGALKRLQVKHAASAEIMTESGAKRWMTHIHRSISAHRAEWDASDVRALPCLNDFLLFFMEKYGTQFDFNVASWMGTLTKRVACTSSKL